MKSIVAVLLLVACAQVPLIFSAINVRKIKPLRVSSSKIYPKHTVAQWNHIKSSQVIKPEVFPGFKKGENPQPAYAGVNLKSHIHSRITGGQRAEHGQIPWQALIERDDNTVCGGSLISLEWVLTSGSCASHSQEFVVILGAQDAFNNSENGRQVLKTRDVTIHENYDPDKFFNDIALLYLNPKASVTKFTNIISLPPRSMQGDDLIGERVTLSGWGYESDSSTVISEYLNYVTMSVISNEECSNTYGDNIIPSELCTDTTGGHSACAGDMGGPLIFEQIIGRYFQVGISSFYYGKGCEKGYPAGFTRVTSFLDWIEAKTGISVRDY